MRENHSFERLFHALADRTRLRLLHLMADQEICVCYFVAVIDVPQPKISRHLAYLRRAGLVQARRDGKWMHYRLAVPADPYAASILKTTLEALRRDREFRHDLQRFQRLCCGPNSLVQLLGAPAPANAMSPTIRGL